jgi:hypothetical protein
MMDERDERFKEYRPVTRVVACGAKLGRLVTGETGNATGSYPIGESWSYSETLPWTPSLAGSFSFRRTFE